MNLLMLLGIFIRNLERKHLLTNRLLSMGVLHEDKLIVHLHWAQRVLRSNRKSWRLLIRGECRLGVIRIRRVIVCLNGMRAGLRDWLIVPSFLKNLKDTLETFAEEPGI